DADGGRHGAEDAGRGADQRSAWSCGGAEELQEDERQATADAADDVKGEEPALAEQRLDGRSEQVEPKHVEQEMAGPGVQQLEGQQLPDEPAAHVGGAQAEPV